MSKTFIIMKREFLEFVQSRMFIVGTLLGPLLIAGFFAIEIAIMTRVGGGSYSVVVVDQTTDGIGQKMAAALAAPKPPRPVGKPVVFHTTVISAPIDVAHLRDSLDARVTSDSLGGYLLIPAGILTGADAEYYGQNATNIGVTSELENTLERTVQTARLAAQGIDPGKVGAALQPVTMNAEKIGKRGVKGSAAAGQVIGYFMTFAIYLVTALYGAAIMNAVLEEKRDKIVEVIVSSVKASQMMVGKVLGIGAAGFLQMLIWVISVGLVLAYAGSIAAFLHLDPQKTVAFTSIAKMLPHVPVSVGALFLLFFLGGFFIYSTLYATIGSIATTNQEAQQLVFPAMMPLMIGFFMSFAALQNPDGGMAVIGSLIPFTAPLVMPVRAVAGSAAPSQIALSLALVVSTGLLLLWIAGKIYRIGIFATGKKPTLKEVAGWIRTA